MQGADSENRETSFNELGEEKVVMEKTTRFQSHSRRKFSSTLTLYPRCGKIVNSQ